MNRSGIIGHEAQIRRLERIASAGTVPNAMLFYGVPGSGKKLVAERFLMSLLCRGENPPCLSCDTCHQIIHGGHPDFIRIVPDAKGTIPIGDDDEPGTVRWLIDRLSRTSVGDRYAVCIDGAEHISVPGQNALLKTIEEPRQGTVIIILTANRTAILPTIQSRCSEMAFSPLTGEQIGRVLGEKGIPEGERDIPAMLSGGSVEIALILSRGDVLSRIIALGEEIAASVNGMVLSPMDITGLLRDLGPATLLTVMVNIFRHLLLARQRGAEPHTLLRRCAIDESENLAKTVKIFLALHGGLTNNLNIRYALKGMVYSMENMVTTGIPALVD